MKFQILVNVKVELTENLNFKLEGQFELSITVQLRQSDQVKCIYTSFKYKGTEIRDK